MKNRLLFIYLILLVISGINHKAGAVSLPAIFSDHMVLQQNAEVTIWGWANPGEEVTVTGSWDNNPVKTKGNNLAQWQVKIKTPVAGPAYTLTVKGFNTLEIQDVLMGEVWLCSGQSNMEWSTRAAIENGKEEIGKANYPAIRFFTVPRRSADGAQLDVPAKWVVCSPETMPDFSAVGYFFGQKIH